MTLTSEQTQLSAEDQAAVAAIPGQIVAAWAAQDGDRFAEVFSEQGTMVLPGQPVRRGRPEIAAFMKTAFAGPYRGTQVTGEPVHLTFLTSETAVVVTSGGVLEEGQSELRADQMVNATWVIDRAGDSWELAAYHNSPAR